MLVVDASVAVRACGRADGFAELSNQTLVAPPLMWSETRAVLRLAVWHGEVGQEQGDRSVERLEASPVKKTDHEQLGQMTWQVAKELGWGRTYDAEYVALARLLDCHLVTLDGRLRRGADRLEFVITPAEL